MKVSFVIVVGYMGSHELFEGRARALGVEFERPPAERIVITGFSQIGPLGGTEETWRDGLLLGESGVRNLPMGNERTNIGAPVKDFKLEDHFTSEEIKKDIKYLSRLQTMGIVCARQAAKMSKLTGEDGKKIIPVFDKDYGRDRIGVWVASGIGGSTELIDVYENLKERDSGGARISALHWQKILSEQLSAVIGLSLGGCSGWSGNTLEACATGASNIIEACERIKSGKADIVFAGGFEEALDKHANVTTGVFTAMQATSKRNNEPKKASRPYDQDRDGFVIGSGGAVVVVERLESALNRPGVTIYAEVTGFEKSMDGKKDLTLPDPRRIAKTIQQSMWEEKLRKFQKIDAIFAHETSTKKGDKFAAEALAQAFGEELKNIPITAIKSMLGHLLGGAGAVNVVNAILALRDGKIPQILNLDKPDPEIVAAGEFYFVRGKTLEKDLNAILATAFGFGGYNASIILRKFKSKDVKYLPSDFYAS